MKKIFLLLSLIFTLPTLGWGKYVALLTETAPGGGINSQKDIVTMKRILGNRYEFIVMNAKEATSINIRKEFEELAKTLTKNDTFVFYYSGHGNRFYTGDEDEADKHDDFLLTSDYNCSGGSNVTNVLTDDELNYLYSKIKARKIIIIDACHSASMNKSSLNFSNVKQFKGCSGGLVTKGFNIDPEYRKANNQNFIHFAAAQEHQSALGSKDGGVFTLMIEKVLKKQGNISFSKLEQFVQRGIESFQPSITTDSTIDKSTLYTKDIFVVSTRKPPKPIVIATDLASLLKQKPKTIKVKTQKGNKFPIHKSVPITGHFNKSSKQYIYLLELKSKNDFSLVASKPNCLSHSKYGYNYTCQFKNLKATTPTGTSDIYMIKTSKPLNLGNSKDSIITDEFFDNAGISLFEQLKDSHFEVGKINITTY